MLSRHPKVNYSLPIMKQAVALEGRHALAILR